MTGAGKSVIVADLLAQIGHRFGFRLIVEEGLSHAVLTQTQGCEPVIVNPKKSTKLKARQFSPDRDPGEASQIGPPFVAAAVIPGAATGSIVSRGTNRYFCSWDQARPIHLKDDFLRERFPRGQEFRFDLSHLTGGRDRNTGTVRTEVWSKV